MNLHNVSHGIFLRRPRISHRESKLSNLVPAAFVTGVPPFAHAHTSGCASGTTGLHTRA